MGTKLTVAAYGRNLTDREYFTGGDPTGTDLGVNTAFPGQRRVFGVELRYKF
jgi:outer membrane receptor protein involved in Fe transport